MPSVTAMARSNSEIVSRHTPTCTDAALARAATAAAPAMARGVRAARQRAASSFADHASMIATPMRGMYV